VTITQAFDPGEASEIHGDGELRALREEVHKLNEQLSGFEERVRHVQQQLRHLADTRDPRHDELATSHTAQVWCCWVTVRPRRLCDLE
jgi:DNA repair exonuclease SbcCD ATPase subunit